MAKAKPKETRAVRQAQAKDRGDRPADETVDGHHVESKIEHVPDDEKAGRQSVQTREIRPDERPEAIGRTPLAGPEPDES